MSAKAISEQTGKEFLYKYISTSAAVQNRFRYANVTAETDFDQLAKEQPWLLTEVRQRNQSRKILKAPRYTRIEMFIFRRGEASHD